MIVVDTSFIYALLDRRVDRHAEAAAWYEGSRDELATTPLVLAETDHLATARAGAHAARAFRQDVAAGAYLVEWWAQAPAEAVAVCQRYADLALSLTDASLICLAARVETIEIASFDQRHLRAVSPLAGADAFRLLPLDA